ncbi:hypothetical protein GBAR_LOCUS1785 [Geodia barretti]|nr:hypothetical protein GBAR_LOCUS1785 [Geodia barretti]
MGPAEKLMQKRESMGGTFGSFSRSERSERSESSAKTKREEPDNRYHLHYSDEDEGVEERGGVASAEGGHMMFRDSKLPPIQLPLDYSVHSRRTAVTTKNKIVKQGVEEDASGPPTCRVKLVKPVSEPGAASTQSQPERMTAAKLFTPSEGSKGQFLFFQLPDCLPLERSDVAMDTSEAPPIQSTAASSATTPAEKRDDEALPSLRDLPDGHIGKIRVHESGKVK